MQTREMHLLPAENGSVAVQYRLWLAPNSRIEGQKSDLQQKPSLRKSPVAFSGQAGDLGGKVGSQALEHVSQVKSAILI